MTNAPVGFQCPNCAAISNPRASRATASSSTASRLAGIPPVTRWILIACSTIYVFGLVTGTSDSLATRFEMNPKAVARGEWERLLTGTFLHAGFLHVLFNMYFLYFIGPGLERFLGSKKFAVLYFLSALGGSTLSFWLTDPQTASVGASGAIFGLLAAAIVIGRHMKQDVSQLTVLLVINVVIGFTGNIDWHAHFGGAITGAVLAAIYVKDSNKLSKNAQNFSTIMVFLALVVLVVLRDQQLSSQFSL